MKEFFRDLIGQVARLLMISAIIAGPVWAQNLTFFLLWVIIVGMSIMSLYGAVAYRESIEKAKKDKEWAKKQLKEKEHWAFNITAFILLGTMAAYGWFWTAAAYAITWFFMWSILTGTKGEFKKILDEETAE